MDEYLTVAQLRHLLGAFPDDAYVSLVSQFGDQRMLTVDSLVSVTDGSQAQDMSHVYLYGETTTPILLRRTMADVLTESQERYLRITFERGTLVGGWGGYSSVRVVRHLAEKGLITLKQPIDAPWRAQITRKGKEILGESDG